MERWGEEGARGYGGPEAAATVKAEDCAWEDGMAGSAGVFGGRLPPLQGRRRIVRRKVRAVSERDVLRGGCCICSGFEFSVQRIMQNGRRCFNLFLI